MYTKGLRSSHQFKACWPYRPHALLSAILGIAEVHALPLLDGIPDEGKSPREVTLCSLSSIEERLPAVAILMARLAEHRQVRSAVVAAVAYAHAVMYVERHAPATCFTKRLLRPLRLSPFFPVWWVGRPVVVHPTQHQGKPFQPGTDSRDRGINPAKLLVRVRARWVAGPKEKEKLGHQRSAFGNLFLDAALLGFQLADPLHSRLHGGHQSGQTAPMVHSPIDQYVPVLQCGSAADDAAVCWRTPGYLCR